MADVFLSYSREHPELTQSLAGDLEAHGFSLWWDTEILPDTRYRAKIDEQLNAARAVVIIWTPSSVRSDWVCAEAEHAYKQGKLVNTHIETFDPVDIPKPFNQINSVDVK